MIKPTYDQLKRALDLAISMLGVYKSGDVRAVSKEFVALAAVAANDATPDMVKVIYDAASSIPGRLSPEQVIQQEVLLIPEGFHHARVVDFGQLRASKAVEGLWILPVKLEIVEMNRRTMFYHVAGFKPALELLRSGNYHSLRFRVEIKHRVANGGRGIYEDPIIEWNTATAEGRIS